MTDAFGDPVNGLTVTFSSSIDNPSRPPIQRATLGGLAYPSIGRAPVWAYYFHVPGQQQLRVTAAG